MSKANQHGSGQCGRELGAGSTIRQNEAHLESRCSYNSPAADAGTGPRGTPRSSARPLPLLLLLLLLLRGPGDGSRANSALRLPRWPAQGTRCSSPRRGPCTPGRSRGSPHSRDRSPGWGGGATQRVYRVGILKGRVCETV